MGLTPESASFLAGVANVEGLFNFLLAELSPFAQDGAIRFKEHR